MSTTIMNDEKITNEILAFAPLMMAYVECSDKLQGHARKMLEALVNPDLDEDERHLTAMALADILYPNPYNGLLGSDLKECEQQGAEHSEETRQALEQMDKEEASFSERLHAALEKAKITQAELAERIGVGQPAISMMLQRDCRP